MTALGHPRGAGTLAHEGIRTLVECLPASLAYGFFPLLGAIDVACVGTSRTTSVAALGLGASVLSPFCVLVSGIALALPSALATTDVAGRAARGMGAARVVASCLRAQALVAAVSLLGLWALTSHLGVLGQAPAITAPAAEYLRASALAVVPVALFATLRELAMTTGARVAPAVVAGVCLVVKLGLSVALFRVVERPLFVAGVTTLLSSALASVLLLGYVAFRGGRSPGARAAARPSSFLVTGLPISVQQLLELGAFYAAAIMAGWLGVNAMAAFSVAMNVVNVCAFLSLSIAQTTAALVARHRAHPTLQRRVASLGARAAMLVPTIASAFLVACHRTLLPGAAAAVAVMIAVGLVADGAQMTYGGALRGLLDHRFLTVASLLAWWGLAVPAAYVLAFRAGLGLVGIWVALSGTLLVVAVALRWRFSSLAAHRVSPSVSALDGAAAVAFE